MNQWVLGIICFFLGSIAYSSFYQVKLLWKLNMNSNFAARAR